MKVYKRLLIKRKNLFLCFLFFYVINYLYSAPHISGKYFKGEPKVRLKVLPEVYQLRIKGVPRKEIAKALGSIGTKKVAVIIVDFYDQRFSSGWATQVNNAFTQFKNYYSEVSYGQLQIDVTFIYQGGNTKTLTGTETPYRMPRNMSYYAQNTEESLSQLVKDAISTSGVTASSYDCVMVLHAGYGAESGPPVKSIWSVYVNWKGLSPPVNGFTDGTIVPEQEHNNASPVGVICHEFGHQLGLPDLYYPAPNGNQYSIVGAWCLMDYGCWLGNPAGSQPAHLSAWCKDFLGWLDVEIVSSTRRNIQLPYVEFSSSVIKVEILTANDPQKEYFLLEYRKKISFDSALPGEGLLIWRVDDSIARDQKRLQYNNINSGVPHLGVDLIEADKTIISNSNHGDSGDPFPGSKNVFNFVPEDYGIKTYSGNIVNICVLNISTESNHCSFDIIMTTGLYVVVRTLDNLPISYARISLETTGVSTTVYTNSSGNIFIELPSTGTWRMQCSLESYLTYYDEVEIFPESVTVKYVTLRYDPRLVVSKNSLTIGNNYFDYNISRPQQILFRYHLNEPGETEIVVYNLSGTPIKIFKNYHNTAGYYEEFWNARDEFGNQLQPGLYFVSYKTKSETKVEKFIIKR